MSWQHAVSSTEQWPHLPLADRRVDALHRTVHEGVRLHVLLAACEGQRCIEAPCRFKLRYLCVHSQGEWCIEAMSSADLKHACQLRLI